MKLFLTSAGLPEETTGEFLKMLPKKPEETEVCFIATAADPYENKCFVEEDRKRLHELEFSISELDLKQEDEDSLKKKLEGVDVIFVEGGNTFYLIKFMRESGFDKILPRLLDEGTIYIGVSAGSIVAGADIEISSWGHEGDKNIVNLEDLTGLGLVPFGISPHYTEEDRATLEEMSKRVSYPVVALTEEQALLVNGEKYEIVGSGEKHIFNTSGTSLNF